MACGFYRKQNPNHCQIKLTCVFVIAVSFFSLMLPLLSSNYSPLLKKLPNLPPWPLSRFDLLSFLSSLLQHLCCSYQDKGIFLPANLNETSAKPADRCDRLCLYIHAWVGIYRIYGVVCGVWTFFSKRTELKKFSSPIAWKNDCIYYITVLYSSNAEVPFLTI